MCQNVFVVRLADRRVDGYMNGPCLLDPHIQKIPFRAAVGNGGYLIPLLYAQFHQSVVDIIRSFDVLINTVFYPLAIYFSCYGIRFRSELSFVIG